ncbi:MAG TPA: glycoside hydrolase 43 family protein [Terriglobales bacterium]|nr:glycoside hydrolase 43 family protein [Terriglobales bacterium]
MSREKPFKINSIVLTLTILIAQSSLHAGGNIARKKASPIPNVSHVWVADNKDGTYKNPILYADYSDPDAIRVGDDFYMTASSFDAVPGLPILHSKDLVNWTIIGHALNQQPPIDVYSKTQHGNGVWAPVMRYHNGEFYIFYPDPEFGIYMVKAKSPAGPWSTPLLIKQARGWIDPCPLWDDDGNAYLVSAMAASRSGIKSVLVVSRMAPDGTKLLDDGALVFDGHEGNATVEGPKFYKHNGYYYIFAPAGGVESGWQLALRAKNVYGPYEQKVVLAQGSTQVNGPHQGAWVKTQTGESWFLHFRDMGAYGRVVYLEPMTWVDDWPVMGKQNEPVATWKKPNVGKVWPVATPADSDEFNSNELGMQWQWQANPKPGWAFPAGGLGFLRIFNIATPPDFKNLWDAPNLLLQKFPGPEFTVITKVTFTPGADGEKIGLIIMGMDYAYVSVEKRTEGLLISQAICKDADRHAPERVSASIPVKGKTFYLRAGVSKQAVASFSYSSDGINFTPIGEPFTARQGRWIGAKVGIFAVGPGTSREIGYADFDWFRFDSF